MILSYYYALSALPLDSAHDLFQGFAVDIVSSIVIHRVQSGYLTLESFHDINQ